ncbi:hypothetical protein CCR95_04280 [Thiocystis minor]|uniref:hypothetical protein n=1 Tax=Thiocystis minor TaxID=61597 RepID=UPI001911BC3A|nr:hypothetical protein [Thiocystis minor]MBK5963326.1 hypothetical protein [Thiocystis minor]
MMQGEFFRIATQITERASDGGISVAEINDIARLNHEEINCYPGEPGGQCHSLAFFFSLQGNLRKGKGHYNFAQILEEFIKHMQGRCVGKTRHAVIITDAWWHDHYEKWHANIEAIQHTGVHVEVYLIGIGGRVSQVNI